MSKKIYIVTKESNETNPVEIGYASSNKIAGKMIDAISRAEEQENNCYTKCQATLDYMEINNVPTCFEDECNTNDDLIVQFAMLWGMQIGSALSAKEIEIAKEMKQWDSTELLQLFSAWKDEYVSQIEKPDICEFFNEKVTDLLHE